MELAEWGLRRGLAELPDEHVDEGVTDGEEFVARRLGPANCKRIARGTRATSRSTVRLSSIGLGGSDAMTAIGTSSPASS